MTTVKYFGEGGIELAADIAGEPGNPPVLLLHGGGQTRHSWGTTQRDLAERGWFVVSLDLRGHGDSAWAPDGDYRLETFARGRRQRGASSSAVPCWSAPRSAAPPR